MKGNDTLMNGNKCPKIAKLNNNWLQNLLY